MSRTPQRPNLKLTNSGHEQAKAVGRFFNALEPRPSICYKTRMNRENVIATLRSHEQRLRTRGVCHAALFGSTARDEAKPESDIDILIEIDPDAQIGVFEYVAITHYLSDLFPVTVDVANRSTLKPHVQPGAERDALYAF